MLIRPATEQDIPAVLEMVRELAIYQDMEDMLGIDDTFMRNEVLREDSPLSCLVIEDSEGHLQGYAALYKTMSMFLGKYGLNVHDLYVKKDARGKGLGKSLMIEIARIAEDGNYGRISWEALNWNTSAISFYKSLGAKHEPDWDMFKVEGQAIKALAQMKI